MNEEELSMAEETKPTEQSDAADVAKAPADVAAAGEPKTKVEVARDLLKEAEQSDAAAQRRSSHVQALQNELDYLTRQPKPNEERVAAVQAQLDEYSDEPTGRKRQTRKS